MGSFLPLRKLARSLVVRDKRKSTNFRLHLPLRQLLLFLSSSMVEKNQVSSSIGIFSAWSRLAFSAELSTKDSDIVWEKFCQTTTHNGDRYVVKLPWKIPFQLLPSNYRLAYGCLKTLLNKNTKAVLENYNEIIMGQLDSEIIEIVEKPFEFINVVHYIPHQAVVKITSNFTKTRIVFNESARLNKNSYSINCCLELGPDLSANLVGMLLRARFAEILITSDIEKAFLQVSVDVSDRDALRFLWLKDYTKPIGKK